MKSQEPQNETSMEPESLKKEEHKDQMISFNELKIKFKCIRFMIESS